MKTLIIDTAGVKGGVALAVGDQIQVKREWSEPRRQSEIVWPHIEEIVKECNWTHGAIEGVVVCNGPGRLTGLRLGLAIAKQFCMTSGARLAQASVFEQVFPALPDVAGKAFLLGDVSGSTVPAQLFQQIDGDWAPVADPRGISINDFGVGLRGIEAIDLQLIAGPQVGEWAAQLESAFPNVERQLVTPTLELLAQCGWKRLKKGVFIDPIDAGPVYLAPAVQR